MSAGTMRDAAVHTVTTTDGTALHVREQGPAGAPVTVVLAHGWTLDHETWDDVALGLSTGPSAARVIRYDHRGHGRSERGPRGSGTIEQLANDLADVVAQRAPDGPLVLGGHSMGGMTIMALAEQSPDIFRDRVVGLGFVATSTGNLLAPLRRVPGFWRIASFVLMLMPFLDRFQPRFLARMGVKAGLFGKSPRAYDVDRAVAQLERADVAARSEFGWSLLHHERAHVIESIAHIPAVVLTSSRDTLTPAAHGRIIAELSPASTLIHFPGAGHQLPYERGVQVTAAMARLVHAASSYAQSAEVPA